MLDDFTSASIDKGSTEANKLPPKKPPVTERLISITFTNVNGKCETTWIRESKMPSFLAGVMGEVWWKGIR